ncbi:LysR family transcriptional regulator [Eubacteriales bacterium]|nr:LysR family transcriptional regulator [Eubacteriales bacterium]GKH62377.1 LysR family transcriptional regulator [Eubacteriales bacterium]
MELKNVHTFLRAAELHNFSRVAQELGYAPSTVTIQIQQLEQELGFQLFERIGKRVSLTPMGKQFAGYANEMMRISYQIKMIGMNPEQITGTLRVGVLESLMDVRLARILPNYCALYPHSSLSVKTGNGGELSLLLRQNDLDLIYILDNKISDPEFISPYSHPEELVFVTYPGHRLVSRTHVELEEILSESLILTERTGLYRKRLAEVAAMRNLTIDPMIEIDNVAVIIQLLQQGHGVSFLPEYAVHEYIKRHLLSTIHTHIEPQHFYSQLFYHKNKWVTPQMEGIISLIKRNF